MDSRTRLVLVAVQVFYGLFPWLGKVAMEAFEPRAVLAWRLMAGTAVLGTAAFLRHGRGAIPRLKDVPMLVLLAVLGIIANQFLFLEGLVRSTAVNAGLLMCVIPVATCGVALAAGQERPTRRRVAGIVLAVFGVAWLFFMRGASLGVDTVTGDLLMTANAISYSFYLVAAKPVLKRLPRLVVAASIFFVGLCSTPIICADVAWIPQAATERHWWALAGVLLFPTVLAYLFNIIVLAKTTATNTAVYVMLQPLIGAGLGIGLLGERPEPSLIVTAAAVIVGLWLVSSPSRRPVAVPVVR